MKHIVQASDGRLFDKEKDCIKYEKDQIPRIKKRNEILMLMFENNCPVKDQRCVGLEEWIFDNFESIRKIMDSKLS